VARLSTLVTGAQGFMGSWLVSRLLDAGDDVVVLDRRVRPGSRYEREGLASQVRTVAASPPPLDGVDTVFHLAAQTVVAEANRDPSATFEANVAGTWRLLDACRAADVQRVVVASSYHAYGRHPEGVYREDTPLEPVWPYDTSKAAADLIARAYAQTYELPVVVLRLSNVYGGGDVEYSRIVPGAARALASGEPPLIRSDGTPQRDFLYVEDAVDAYLAVAAAAAEHRGRVFNAGAGEAVSILDLVRALIRASGRDIEPDVQGTPGPRDAIDRQLLDTTRIRETLGWTPRHALDEGLAKTWAWYAEALG